MSRKAKRRQAVVLAIETVIVMGIFVAACILFGHLLNYVFTLAGVA